MLCVYLILITCKEVINLPKNADAFPSNSTGEITTNNPPDTTQDNKLPNSDEVLCQSCEEYLPPLPERRYSVDELGMFQLSPGPPTSLDITVQDIKNFTE